MLEVKYTWFPSVKIELRRNKWSTYSVGKMPAKSIGVPWIIYYSLVEVTNWKVKNATVVLA